VFNQVTSTSRSEFGNPLILHASISFEKAYAKASNVADKLMKAEGDKTDKFLEHFADEIDEWMKEFSAKFGF